MPSAKTIVQLVLQNWIAKFSVTPYLMELQWLPIRQHTIYKVNPTVFKALNGDAPDYIQSLFFLDQPLRSLRSSDKAYKLKDHRWKLKSKGFILFCSTMLLERPPDDICDIKLKLNECS